MDAFPLFMKDPRNAVVAQQVSWGVEGYLFDGAEGSQVVIFQCAKNGMSKEHVHEFDEYFVVIQGEYALGIGAQRIVLRAGDEYHIPKGMPHDGSFTAGTRTINVFGGKRAERTSRGTPG